MSFLGKERWGVSGLGSSACKIPNRFPSESAFELHLLRQTPYYYESRRQRESAELALAVSGYGGGPDRCVVKVADRPYSPSGYGGGPDRCVVKVPGIVPGKIPKPASISGKTTKSMARNELEASEVTAARQEAMEYKVDVLEREMGDMQKQMSGIKDQINRLETLMQGLMSSQTRATEQSNLESIQGIQLMRTPEGNFKFPSTGPSVVVTGWDDDPLPHAVIASPTLNNMNPSHGPEMAKDMEKGVSAVAKKHAQNAIVGQNMNLTIAARGKLLNDAIVHKKETPHMNLMAGVSEEVVSEQGERSNHPITISYPFTHNLPKDIMPADLDWSIDDKHAFIEEVVLNTLDKQVRHFTGSGNTSVVYPLKPVIEEIQKSDLAQLYKVGRADRRLRRLGLLWYLPPWPGLNFCEVNWMTNGREKGAGTAAKKDSYNAVTGQSKIYSQQAKSKPFIEAGVKNEIVGAANGTPSTDLIASGNNTPQICFSPMKYGTGTIENRNNSPVVATPPPEFCCLISMKLMSEPVMIASGQTYGREKLSQSCHVHIKQGAFLYNLEVQKLPKSHHYFFIRLKLEYHKFSSLDSYEISACKFNHPKHKYYVILSKKIIAASVVMNLTVSSSKEPGNIVFHILTEAKNFYAKKLWFVSNVYKKVINSGSILMRQLTEFNPLQFNAVYCSEGYIGYAVVRFTKNWNETNQPGKYIYGWLAQEEDYKSDDLKTVADQNDSLRMARIGQQTVDKSVLRFVEKHKVSRKEICGYVMEQQIHKLLRSSIIRPSHFVVQAILVKRKVLDARDSLGTCGTDREMMVRKADPNKRIVLLLNKIDLIPKKSVEKWFTYLREEMPTVKCNTQEQRTKRRWKSSKLDKTSNIPQAELLCSLAIKTSIGNINPGMDEAWQKLQHHVVKKNDNDIVIYASQLTVKPRLLELAYLVESRTLENVLGGIYGVLNQKRGFVQVYYEPIKQIIKTYMNDQKDKLWPILRKRGVTMKIDEKELMGKALIKSVLQTGLPASNALLEMMVFHLSYPLKAQKYRVENLFEGLLDNIHAIAFRNCDSEGLLMLYDFKMITKSDKGRFLGCGRVFLGKEATGMKFYIMGSNYVPGQNKDLYMTSVQHAVIWMGRKQEYVEEVPCGNTVDMVGSDQFITNIATLTNEKACSGKFHSHYQFSYFDSVESLPTYPLFPKDLKPLNSRCDAQISVLSSKLQKKMRDANIFVVGSGALGCELLNNLVLMGVSCSHKGTLILTHTDFIEKSNWSRQFLFRDGNIGLAKSTIAAVATYATNSCLHIDAHQNCACPETEHVFPMHSGRPLILSLMHLITSRLGSIWYCLGFLNFTPRPSKPDFHT